MRDFHYTVNVLVKAYLNDTLSHGDCTACAVGNIIADSLGCKVVKDELNWLRNGAYVIPVWGEVFLSSYPGHQDVDPKNYKGWAKRQIDASGYSWEELARIEKAFELHNCGIDFAIDADDEQAMDKAMFNGLMAVVDVLADIHNIDLKVREEVKSLFVKN